MRIALIAPSMTPSVDGVADYAERLGEGLAQRGHSILYLGLNDFHKGSRSFESRRGDQSVVNFSAYEPYPERRSKALAALAAFAPDALGVQYYWRGWWAGRRHGQMAGLIRQAGIKARRHIMYHETWEEVGFAGRMPKIARHFLVGLTMAAFHLRLRPDASFTNTALYARQLRRLGVRAAVAAVPSNIPVMPDSLSGRDRLWAQIQAAGVGSLARDSAWVAVMFGRLQPEWEAEAAMPWLERARAASGRSAGVLVSIGNSSYEDRGWHRIDRTAKAAGFRTAKLGRQESGVVSQLMHLADLGVVTTRGELLGKSGTYATMAEHGLPVFLNDHRSLPADGADFVLPGERFAASLAAARRQAPRSSRWTELVLRYERAMGGA